MSNPAERLSFKPWSGAGPPQRILIIRLHAIGDVAITFPVCMALREKFPQARIDFLTTTDAAPLVDALDIFNAVHRLSNSQDRGRRLYHALKWAYQLRPQAYDIVLDLQRNWVSRAVRRAGAAKAWSEFDRFAPRPAGMRALEAARRLGFTDFELCYRVQLRPELEASAARLLSEHGRDETKRLIVLNPAGWWETRNWPLQNYIDFAGLWLEKEKVQFLFLGTDRIRAKAARIQEELKGAVINLCEKTSLAEGLAVLQRAALMVSEDSGLMHMAWVSGIPTLALFGSSRHDWSVPLGRHSRCLHSGDLPCGACMSPTCRYGDIHCLTRHTPQTILQAAEELLAGVRL